MARTVARTLACAMVLGIASAAWASSASAHATLEASTPNDGSRQDDAPPSVSITLSDPVAVAPSPLTVTDADGQLVATGEVALAGGTLIASLPVLTDGSYLVTYRAIAEDGHPIRGETTFSVGGTADAGGAGDDQGHVDEPVRRTRRADDLVTRPEGLG